MSPKLARADFDRVKLGMVEVVPIAAVEWGALNPARGENGPRAADLWGDRTETCATGFLVRFAEGFSSPPHIHNTTYRGVVIEGLIHNDDSGAAEMWMPAGSYWTQPAGESHITAADGSGRLVYIEIQSGPYLVQPVEETFDAGERAVNIHASNLVWLDESSAAGIDLPASVLAGEGPRVSYLWGNPQDEEASGALVELPAGFAGNLHSDGPSLRVVVVTGQPSVILPKSDGGVQLDPGSYIGSSAGGGQWLSLTTNKKCVIYVRSEGALSVTSTEPR